MPLHLDAGLEPVAGYTLVRRLGRGGFGEVWEALAPGDVRVALKFIRLDTNQAGSEQRALEVIRDIRHPHLLDVQFATRVGDCLVIAMPLCDESLMDRLRACQAQGQPGLPRDELLGYMEDIARAVDFLNEPRPRAGGGGGSGSGSGGRAGVQHRDIKPHNIFLVGDSVRLADFGLAKIVAANLASHTGSMSPSYVAPEVIEGRVSRRSDQYSLAITYTQLRTGRLPFAGESVHQVIYAHVHNAPDLSDLPEAERAVVARALAKRPEGRWPSCRAFVIALAATTRAGDGRPEPPDGWTLVAGVRDGGDTVPMTKCLTRLPATQRPTPPPDTWAASGEREPPSIAGAGPAGMTLVLIPAGEFLMGSPDAHADDEDADDNEKPWHRVRITRPFYLGACAVTQEVYERVLGRNPSHFSPRGKYRKKVAGLDTSKHPVENVSWHDAIAFCNALSVSEGLEPYYRFGAGARSGGGGYRLPTEAEWEYACRAGSTTRYSFGDDEASLVEYAWIAGNSGEITHPVGAKRPNAFGLYDMHGNVWEWCWDGYQRDYYANSPADDPLGPSQAAERVSRGGGWVCLPRLARSAYRGRSTPAYRFRDLGFRVARFAADP